MPLPRSARFFTAAVLGLAAGVAFWVRDGDIAPFLDIRAELLRVSDEFAFSMWTIGVTARGGETLDEVRIEPGIGPVILPPEAARARPTLKSGWATRFDVRVEGPRTTDASVRIVQTGRVSRTYEVPLTVKR